MLAHLLHPELVAAPEGIGFERFETSLPAR